jgi:hypothetical protein
MVAFTALANIAIGTICGVEAHAVLATAPKVWPLGGLFAGETAQRPGCNCRDKEWAHVRVRWEVNEVLLQAVDVRSVGPPLLLHHVHARVERWLWRQGRGNRASAGTVKRGEIDEEGQKANRNRWLATADAVAHDVRQERFAGAVIDWTEGCAGAIRPPVDDVQDNTEATPHDDDCSPWLRARRGSCGLWPAARGSCCR